MVNLTRCLVHWDGSSVTQCLGGIITVPSVNGEVRGIYVLAGGSKCSVVIADWLVCIADEEEDSDVDFEADVRLEYKARVDSLCLIHGQTLTGS